MTYKEEQDEEQIEYLEKDIPRFDSSEHEVRYILNRNCGSRGNPHAKHMVMVIKDNQIVFEKYNGTEFNEGKIEMLIRDNQLAKDDKEYFIITPDDVPDIITKDTLFFNNRRNYLFKCHFEHAGKEIFDAKNHESVLEKIKLLQLEILS